MDENIIIPEENPIIEEIPVVIEPQIIIENGKQYTCYFENGCISRICNGEVEETILEDGTILTNIIPLVEESTLPSLDQRVSILEELKLQEIMGGIL